MCQGLFQPSSHVVEQRSGSRCANRAALVSRPALYLLFNPVQRGDAFYGFGGDRRLVRLHQFEELAPDMGHARCFLDGAAFIELVEARVGVGLQDAAKVRQMALRMLALAIRRVGEPNGGGSGIARWPAIAHIGPEPCGLRPSMTGGKHRKGRVVAMQLVGAHPIAA